MFTIDFYTFNLLEGVFWIALAFVVVFYLLEEIPKRYQFLGAFTGATLFIFGVTDFLESYLGSAMYHPHEWLFGIKFLMVLGQLGAVIWYARLRMQEPADGAASEAAA